MKTKAFSLIELLIVIVIVGITYTFAVQSFSKLKDAQDSLTLGTLKKYLEKSEYEKKIQILCLDECENCYLLRDSKRDEQVIKGFLDDSVVVYRYDFLYGYTKIQEHVYFNENESQENVCFSYTINKSGTGDQVLVEFKNKFYDFSDYLRGTLVYDSLESAQEAKEKQSSDVL